MEGVLGRVEERKARRLGNMMNFISVQIKFISLTTTKPLLLSINVYRYNCSQHLFLNYDWYIQSNYSCEFKFENSTAKEHHMTDQTYFNLVKLAYFNCTSKEEWKVIVTSLAAVDVAKLSYYELLLPLQIYLGTSVCSTNSGFINIKFYWFDPWKYLYK